MCKCIKNLHMKDVPSLLCCQCGEIQCLLCEHYYKCSSCLSFSCEECTMKLLCSHSYCSLQCVIFNKEKTCSDYCFFLRDVDSTGKDKEGLTKLMDYWIQKVGENHFLFWIIKIINEKNDSTNRIKDKIELISDLYSSLYEKHKE